MSNKKVLILGASDNPERYSYKAFHMLKQHGYESVLVSPRLKSLDGQPVYKEMKGMSDIDTVSVYVNKEISFGLRNELYALNPRRVIFNPGSENSELMDELETKGIVVEAACTLVLLAANQF